MDKRFFLVAYDLTDMHIERLVVKLLKKFGMRYQYSIFICHITEEQREKLLEGIGRIFTEAKTTPGEETGLFRISVIPLCGICAASRQEIGDAFGWPTGSIVVP